MQHTTSRTSMSDLPAEDHVCEDRDMDEERNSLFHPRQDAAWRILLHHAVHAKFGCTLYVRACCTVAALNSRTEVLYVPYVRSIGF